MDLSLLAQTWDWLSANPYVRAAVLMALALLLAKLVDFFFTRGLKLVTRHTKTDLDDVIIAQLHRPVQLTVIMAAAVIAVRVIVDDEHLQGEVSRIIYSIALLLWTGVAIRASRTLFKAIIHRRSDDRPLAQALPLLDNLMVVVLVVHGAFWLFDIWKINVTPLLASAGIVTAAVALASKDTLANFFGGVSVFMDRPYRLGDYIILEGGERGEVVQIGVRSTRILTRDDVMITVPNSVMSNSKIINESGLVPRFRVRATVGVGYGSDPEQVERVLLEALEGVPEVLAAPSPRVRFREFGDSALVFQLMAWVHDPADRGRVLHEINKNILVKLRAAGVEIPFPQRVLHMPRGDADPTDQDMG